MPQDLDAANTDINKAYMGKKGKKKENSCKLNIQAVTSARSSDSTLTFERQKEEAFGE